MPSKKAEQTGRRRGKDKAIDKKKRNGKYTTKGLRKKANMIEKRVEEKRVETN